MIGNTQAAENSVQNISSDRAEKYMENGIRRQPDIIRNQRIYDFYQDFLKRDPTEKSIHLETEKMPEFARDYIAKVRRHTDALDALILTGWLPYVALSIGNNVYVQAYGRKHYCRLWGMLIGPSTTSRKTTCMEMGRYTLKKWEDSLSKLPKKERIKERSVINISTNAKIIELMALNANRLWELSETNQLLQASRLLHNFGLIEQLTTLYDGGNLHAHNMERDTYVSSPALSIIGGITSEDFCSNMTKFVDIGSGFLQRFVYAVSGDDKRRNLIEADNNISVLYDYERIYEIFRSIPGQHELKLGSSQKEKIAQLSSDSQDKLAKTEFLSQFSARIYSGSFYAILIIFTMMEKHKELAKAIIDGDTKQFFENLVISDECFDAAITLCAYYEKTSTRLFETVVRYDEIKHEKRVIKYLLEQENFKENHSRLMPNLNLNAKQIKTVIEELTQRGFVEHEIIRQKGRKAKSCYRLVHPDD